MMEGYGVAQTSAHFAAAHPLLEPRAVFETLLKAGLVGLYPDFREWFYGKVVPGLHTGERCILPWTIDSKLAGVAVCKRTPLERKLCTLWVSPDFRARGIAASLAREAFAWIGDPKPLFTVPEERMAEFAGLTEAWAFSAPTAYEGLYRTGRVEYVFNGPLRVAAH